MTTTTEVRVTVYLTLTAAEEYAQFKDDSDLESSIDARLDEVYDADGSPVSPKVWGINVETDEEMTEEELALSRSTPGFQLA